jgi:diguanylate cyclase (GGDEF)-like protein
VIGRTLGKGLAGSHESILDSYRLLADVFRNLLEEEDLEGLLDRIADTLSDLIPYDSLIIYQADEANAQLKPIVARDQWAEEILNSPTRIGKGVTGWAVRHREPVLSNEVHLDPRAEQIPGTPEEQEALICVPLISRDRIKGALNIYRTGATKFRDEEFELAKRFGDAAALALDNAEIRAQLQFQAQTDSLTGLYNHRHFHERLRAELTRASRSRDSVALLIFDIDDFKRVNDVHGHGVGDQVLVGIAELLAQIARASDVTCRVGGEEFAVILPSCNAADALGFASRLNGLLSETIFEPAGNMMISVGIAQSPSHATNPRELVACAETAMMAAKAFGKNRVLVFDDELGERSELALTERQELRSIAHLKMLQSLAGKLNRLNDVRQIGTVIANELRTLIDYHNCRVYVVEDDWLLPIAFQGELTHYLNETFEAIKCRIGEGITGKAAATGKPVLIPNALECEFALPVVGTDEIEESILAVPLAYGVTVIGVLVLSKLGVDQFDGDDVRLLEVLAGHASVALENARLYEAQRKEATHAKALLEYADAATKARDFHSIGEETVRMAAKLLEVEQAALMLQDERSGEFRVVSHTGYVGDPGAEPLVRTRWTEDIGQRFLADHREPFVIAPKDLIGIFPVPPGVRLVELAVAPVDAGNGRRGWIGVRNSMNKANHFTDERMLLLAGLSSHASMALQKAIAYRDQKESAEIASRLLNFSRELSIAHGPIEVLDRICELSARILGSPSSVVWLQSLDSGDLIAESVWGIHGKKLHVLKQTSFDGQLARAFSAISGPFVLTAKQVGGVQGASQASSGSPVAIAPLRLDGDRLGNILVSAPALGEYEFSERKMRLLEGIAHQAQIAINNALSFESLERTFLDTVEALANALEAKDEYTSSHARWITDTALEVGTTLGMDGKTLKRLELGALFHDIGKIGIPSDILLKPGPLDDHEWEIIRMHPELGERILAPIARLAEVRPIIRHCHEHYDGSGYPDRKIGDDIPIESRIILVVDAFHAMTTDRPYRRRLSVGEACRRLSRAAGVQFDPNVVDVFLGLLEERPELADTA